MRKSVITAIGCLVLVTLTVEAQEMKIDTMRRHKLTVDTSLSKAIHQDTRIKSRDWLSEAKKKPLSTMSSLIVVTDENLGKSIKVLQNNTLRLDRFINISNGQAWNYSPFPNGYLDARTLSMPLPR